MKHPTIKFQKNTIKEIIKKLKKTYPKSKITLSANKDPLKLLVATMLSAQCADKIVNKVTPYIFKKYKTLRDYADMNIKVFMKEIRAIGLYRNKAKNIKEMAKIIMKEYNSKVPDSIDRLTRLPGVGRKTANIVLSNAFCKNEGIAVDTHVKRISQRLGLTNKTTPVSIEADLLKIIPKREWGVFNHLLVQHGRAICKAQKPIHHLCMLKRYCRYYKIAYEKTQQ